MRIAIDLDNVTLDFQGHWPDLYRRWFDREIDPDHLESWDGIITGTHFADIGTALTWFARADGWSTMPPLPGAYGAIAQLADAGHPLSFVTARTGLAVAPTVAWFDRMRAWLPRPGIHQLHTDCSAKHTVPASIYLDDSPDVIRGLVGAGKPTIVFDRPWNRSLGKVAVGAVKRLVPVESRIERATSWASALDLIQGVLR